MQLRLRFGVRLGGAWGGTAPADRTPPPHCCTQLLLHRRRRRLASTPAVSVRVSLSLLRLSRAAAAAGPLRVRARDHLQRHPHALLRHRHPGDARRRPAVRLRARHQHVHGVAALRVRGVDPGLPALREGTRAGPMCPPGCPLPPGRRGLLPPSRIPALFLSVRRLPHYGSRFRPRPPR